MTDDSKKTGSEDPGNEEFKFPSLHEEEEKAPEEIKAAEPVKWLLLPMTRKPAVLILTTGMSGQ